MTTKTRAIISILAILLVGVVFYMISARTAIAPIENGNGEGTETSSPLVKLTTPRPNDEIISPLIVTGEARGNWYFEASFPVRLLDSSGKEIAVIPAQAQGDWMTTEFVPFEVTLTFGTPETETGTLVLEKDNPSGLSEYADEVRIPIRFKNTGGSTSGTSGIRGMVTIGPTCPVVQYPPDGACGDKPFSIELLLIVITGDKARAIKKFNSNTDGTFQINATPGRYIIQSSTSNTPPYCPNTKEINVIAGSYAEITIQCDSGIR